MAAASEELPRQESESTVFRTRGWRVPALWLLSVAVRLWCRTLRFECSPRDFENGSYHDEPVLLLLWHNRLFVTPWLLRVLRHHRQVVGLVSASRDGANLSAFLEFIGITTVRGSSSRLGREALHQVIATHRAGHDVAVTPDGPRGPVYDMKPGALLAARRTRARLVLIGVQCRNAWRMPSWDEFRIPKPFSRVVIRCECVQADEFGHGNEALARLRERLLELNGEPA